MGPGAFAEMMYRADAAPWDIGECQPVIRQLVALGAVKGDVLDPGCGTGWHAIEYALAGCSVTGLDVAPTAVHRARTNARRAGAAVDFRQCDVTTLDSTVSCYDTVVDSKCYDNLETTHDRQRYVTGLHRATKPDARLFIYGFGPGDINGIHNHLLDEPDYETVLPAAGFDITYIGQTTYLLKGFERICPACPQQVPDGPVHIPVTEVHATRRGEI